MINFVNIPDAEIKANQSSVDLLGAAMIERIGVGTMSEIDRDFVADLILFFNRNLLIFNFTFIFLFPFFIISLLGKMVKHDFIVIR